MTSLIKTATLDLDTIASLLGEQKKKEDDRYVRHGFEHLLYKHNFDKKMLYLLDMPYEQMFVPEKSTLEISQGKYHCIACAAIGIKNRESHFNWHKKELGNHE